MGHMKHTAFHFFQKLSQVVMVKGQGTLGTDKETLKIDEENRNMQMLVHFQ